MRAAPLDAGWAALGGGDWERARACFAEALAGGETPEALEGMEWAAHMLNEDRLTLDVRGARLNVQLNGRYDGTTPRGNVSVTSAAGRFRGSDADWIVAAGGEAVLQVKGELEGTFATLRLRLTDAGEPSAADSFAVRVGGYESGLVAVDRGNVQVR